MISRQIFICLRQNSIKLLITSIAGLEKILDDSVELINLTRKGIQYQLFNSIVKEGPFKIKEWSLFLHIKERTLQRYKKENKTFEPM